MKKYITNNLDDDREYIRSFALINPKQLQQEPFVVELEQSDEGLIPHLHIYWDKSKDKKNCSYIRLDKPEYLPKHDSIILNHGQRKDLVKFLSRIWKTAQVESIYDENNIKIANGYEAAVQLWNDTYRVSTLINYDEVGFPIMPDYMQLEEI